jgi:hypothetical protein
MKQKQDDTATREKVYDRWLRRVERSKTVRKDWETRFRVIDCEKYLLGEQWGMGERKELIFNHFLATVKTIQPSLFVSNPKFLVRPKPGHKAVATDRMAAQGEGVLTAIATQDQHLESAANLAILQCFSRVACLKSVYAPKLEPNPQGGDPIFETNEAGMPRLDPQTFQPIIDPMTGQPAMNQETGEPLMDTSKAQPLQMKDEETGEPLFEPEFVVTDEVYRWEWVDATKLLLPDEGPDMAKWPWLGEEITVPLSEAKGDPRFPEELRILLKSNQGSEDERRDMGTSDDEDEEDGVVKYYEIYDLKKKRWLVIAPDQTFKEALIDSELPPGIEDHPYSILPGWIPIIGPKPCPWPMPYTSAWLDPQREYNIRRQQMVQGAKRSARKVIYDDATFDDPDEAVKMFQSPYDMEAVKVRDVSRPPQMFSEHDLNNSIYRDVSSLQTDWMIITGQPGARQGSPSKSTATEVGFVERAANLRDADLQTGVRKWLTNAGLKMLKLVQATMTLDMWVRIKGFDDQEIKEYATNVYGLTPQTLKYFPGLRDAMAERLGQQKWQSVTREQLIFDGIVEVVPGSFRPRNLDVEREQWLGFLQIMGQFPQLAMSRELLAETAAKFDFISERMLDEMTALSQQMMQNQQQVAGREQGGTNGQGSQPPPGGPPPEGQ